MLERFYFVIHLSRSRVKLYQVSIGKSLSCVLQVDQAYNPPALEEVFSAKNLKTKIVRVLFSDDLSYVVKITIPKAIAVTRDYIGGLLKEQIPEVLSDTDWDYKQISTAGDSKVVMAFAPVKEFKDKVNTLSSKLSLTIEAIEPESVAITRHPDPVIGLALKNDLSGSDDQTLNLAINRSVKRSLPPSLIFVPLLIIFLFANFMVYRYFKNITDTSSLNPKSVQPTSVTNPTPLPPSPTVRPFNRSLISIKILNGSGIPGAAGKVSPKIQALGYADVTTGNADNSDYPITKITIKSDEFLADYYQDLKTLFSINSESFLVDNTQDPDVIVILGKN
ncbi:MAG: LytR C-terminal domain-containing protein [Candidatus Shapirobacteria bacterium]|jgi:hypothetical protein